MNRILNFIATLFGDTHAATLARSSLARRFARGTAWSFAGVIASRSSTLIGSFVAGHILGREMFGQMGIIQSTVVMFGSLAGFGMGVTATKYVAALREQDKVRAGSSARACLTVAWASGSIMTVALYVFAPWLAAETMAAPELANPLRVTAICLLLGAVGATQNGILTGLEAMKEVARATTLANLGSAIALIAGAWFFGLPGAIASMVVGSLATYALQRRILNSASARHGLAIRAGGDFDWTMLWSFSIPAMLAGVMTGPVNWFCNTMLVNQSGGYREMGAYNAATQFLMALNFVPIVLSQAVLPMLSERMGARDKGGTLKIMNLSIKINGLAVWPLVLGGCAISPWLMRLYGPDFSDASMTMIWSLITAGVLASMIPVGQVLAAAGHMWTGFFMNLGWASCFLIASRQLIDEGSAGLARARLIAYLMHAAWTFMYARHLMRAHGRDVAPGNAMAGNGDVRIG